MSARGGEFETGEGVTVMRAILQTAKLSALAILLSSGAALAQPAAAQATEPPKTETPADKDKAAPEFTPQVGQPGKDVIWVPTPQATVERMLTMANAKPGDYVIDLGSGDGRTVIEAAKRGIRALGIEYNPDMVALSKRNAEKEKEQVGDRAQFVHGDIFEIDFSKSTVLTMYLLPRLNIKLRPTILNMKPGTRVVSHSFNMDDWQPDDALNSAGEKCTDYCAAYFWIVPAKVDGRWRVPQGRLALKQKYQIFTGTFRTRGKRLKIEDGRIRGEALSFTAGGVNYSGTVKGKKMALKVEKATAKKQ